MIHLTPSNTRLNILLNNTNKALVQALLDASETDLKGLLKGDVDLRSIIDRVLQQTSGDNSLNEAILALVKNNPTLNSLGDTSATINQLLKILQSDKTPLPIEKVLKNALVDIKDIKSVDLKPKLENSGVFLESKMKSIQNPVVELKSHLNNLKELLQSSKLKASRFIIKDVENLLKNQVIKNVNSKESMKDLKQNPKALENISKQVKSLVQNLGKQIQKVDPIYTIKTQDILTKLELINASTQTKNISDKIEHQPVRKESKQLKQKVSKVSTPALSDKIVNTSKTNSINLSNKDKQSATTVQLDQPKESKQPRHFKQSHQSNQPKQNTQKIVTQTSADKITTVLKSKSSNASPKAFKMGKTVQKIQIPRVMENKFELEKPVVNNVVSKQLQKIQLPLPAQSVMEVKNLNQASPQMQNQTKSPSKINKQTVILDDKVIKLPLVKESLASLQSVLDKSLTSESKPLLRHLKRIMSTLHGSQEISSKTRQEISKLLLDTKQVVQKADLIYSKDLLTIFAKLKELSSAPNLHFDHKMKEMLSNDLKATLLQTTQELENSSNPNKHELIKHMDKLSLQIDHYQLLSHLSNGSSVYLPISWEQFEGGNIHIKKDKDRFYCDIELKLKEYGDLSLKLMLFEKNQINIHVYSKNQELKDLFQEHLSLLRSGLMSTQIIPREIRFHDALAKKEDQPYQEDDDFAMGFEVKG